MVRGSRTRPPPSFPPRSAAPRPGKRLVDPGLAAAALSQREGPLTSREHEVLAASRAHATIAGPSVGSVFVPGHGP